MFVVSVWFSVPLGYCNCPPRLLTRPAHYTRTHLQNAHLMQSQVYSTVHITEPESQRRNDAESGLRIRNPGQPQRATAERSCGSYASSFGIRTGGIPRDEGG
ncbi:hypothetical protein BP00DRAFT_88049 [Aspergillus indologenus CBS 114.80]|uniref:Uncharacterized protein n=1 Tax=Aspergillus indologenus CBS 114.80 TaxID=1450541 RepID=A0A2V5HPJ4_9EURO|nr:hypothetical protein BP00DRAFT_88049 [Aspergillus indologenus CBS 114.80]